MPTLELRNFTKNETSLVVITEIKSRSYLDYCLSTCDEKMKKYFFKISIRNLESFDLSKNAKNIFRFFQNCIFKFFSLENSNERKYNFVENRADWSVLSANQNWAFGDLFVSTEFCQPRHFRCDHQANEVNWWQGLLRQRFGDSCFIIWVTTNNVFV